MAHSLPLINQLKENCGGCLMSKQTRKSFSPQASFFAKATLAVVHVDLCGPISPTTPAGNRYFMLLVDNYTRMMCVYMIKIKDEALTCFKKFKLLVENGRKQGIQVLRSDRGGEFCSNEFKNFCDNNGILWHYTTPYTPQQNGVIERCNRTVVAMARSLLKEKKVPAQFWREAVRYVVHILNKLPTRSMSTVTSYEAWYGKKPSVGHLKIFGCTAFIKIHAARITKLDDGHKLVVHFGREPGTKAYRLYNPVTSNIHVSRDVIFNECQAWEWDSKNRLQNVKQDNSFWRMMTLTLLKKLH